MKYHLLLVLLSLHVSCSFIANRSSSPSASLAVSSSSAGITPKVRKHRRFDERAVLLEYMAIGKFPDALHKKMKNRFTRPPTPNSVAEAVLAMLLVERAAVMGTSLSSLASEMNFDILQALNSNPFLRYPQFFAKITEVLVNQFDDEEFYQQLAGIIASRVKELKDSVDNTETLLSMPTMQKEQFSTATEGEINADLFRRGDGIVLEADLLANQGEYQEALKRLAALKLNSPLQQIAKEKKIEISNKAVHDLRKKAAIAYQKAGTISDTNTRIAYLHEASTYLKQAINTYPEAEVLHTVKNNLSTIAVALQKLQVKR